MKEIRLAATCIIAAASTLFLTPTPSRAQVENTNYGVNSFASNTSGSSGTAVGYGAMNANTTGNSNTALGDNALVSNTTGSYNTAFGSGSLYYNLTGNYNVANGLDALYNNSSAWNNMALGSYTLYYDTTGGGNAAIGNFALYHNVSGNYNIGIGYAAGEYTTTGSNNIEIANTGLSTDNGVIRIGAQGTQNSTFIAGINGVTSSGGVQVYVNGNGQLGTITSSRRFKYDINSLGEISDKLMKLRPVTFRYKEAAADGSHPIQYGLIAEEVAEVFPDLVQNDKEGKPFTVYYNLLTPMLLNAYQKEHQRMNEQQTEIDTLKSDIAALKHARQQPASNAPIAAAGAFGLLTIGCFAAGRKQKQ